jgi:ATP phosphoribosyltransferase regulatory subunit
MSAWVLPDQIADVLPSEARHIEELRRALLDTARTHGYELVMPPMLEYLESLLTGTGQALDIQTFKLVDQLSGRTLGLRADTTPQVARIDAHLLNRTSVTRLCYCGPVVHTRVDRPHATREPLQLGAELYGHQGLEADLEVMELAVACLQAAGIHKVLLDLGDVRVVDAVLQGLSLKPDLVASIHTALAAKDVALLAQLSQGLPDTVQNALQALTRLYGGPEVLDAAEKTLPASTELHQALKDLRWLAKQVPAGVEVSIDLADLRGYSYYTGMRFAMFGASDAQSTPVELVRGGRYDNVGEIFGRQRPAAGFSLDLKELVAALPNTPQRLAIRAPWGGDAALRTAISQLRTQGETVVCVLPGHEHEVQEFQCDRALVDRNGAWVLEPLKA